MTASWDARIDLFWDSADSTQAGVMFGAMAALVAERASDDPDALYEWASIHDFLDRAEEAVPLYKAALEHGLKGPRRAQAIVQLASSLRNSGKPKEAIDLLERHPQDLVTGNAAQAFLALALRDCGRHDEALSVALRALASTLPLYGRSVTAYADDLLLQDVQSADAAQGVQAGA